MEPLIRLFWTSGDVSFGFQARVGSRIRKLPKDRNDKRLVLFPWILIRCSQFNCSFGSRFLSIIWQTFDEIERRHWESMSNEWEREKQKILNALIGQGQDTLDFPQDTEVKDYDWYLMFSFSESSDNFLNGQADFQFTFPNGQQVEIPKKKQWILNWLMVHQWFAKFKFTRASQISVYLFCMSKLLLAKKV